MIIGIPPRPSLILDGNSSGVARGWALRPPTEILGGNFSEAKKKWVGEEEEERREGKEKGERGKGEKRGK